MEAQGVDLSRTVWMMRLDKLDGEIRQWMNRRFNGT
eukprot:COSAG02_NODE_54020_length_298_cov_1.005025_1_plen_35_part_10